MNIVDRWHTKKPPKAGGVAPCKQHEGLYPKAEHGKGHRWQVRWRDADGKQCSANRPKKTGKDPEVHAEALAAKIKRDLDTGTYVAPDAAAVTLEAYGRQWEKGQTSDHSSRETVSGRLKLWVYPRIGGQRLSLLAARPSLIQQWIKGMERDGLGASSIGDVARIVSSIFIAAMDDGLISKNPLRAKSVRLPKVPERKVVPWTVGTLRDVRAEMPPRFRAMVDLGAGCGMRQGEISAIGVDDIAFLTRAVSVRRQIRVVRNTPVFAPPRFGKTREVPLENSVGLALSAHLADYPPVAVTLPWLHPDGELVTVRLVFTRLDGRPLDRTYLNREWRGARKACGVEHSRANGMHILRHTFASACLAEGVDIRTLAEFLGHVDPAFTLRTYSHLMPNAADRTRRAIGRFLSGDASESAPDVPSVR